MKSNILLKTLGASLVVLVLVGGLGYISVSYLKSNAASIVDHTLPGLTYAGAANASLAESYKSLLLLLIAEAPDERNALRNAVFDSSEETTQNLNNYAKAISDPEDRHNFDTLTRRRERYLKARAEIMALADQGRQTEALHQFKQELAPAYEEYRASGETILNYNIHEAANRGRAITTICNLTQVFVAFIGVLVFVTGFLLGLFR